MKVERFYTTKKQKISAHFNSNEFACKDGSALILIDTDFVKSELEIIREYFNKPMIINSGFRTDSYNKKVGGAKNSYHIKGRAFDVHIDNVAPMAIAEYAERIGIKGIIVYPKQGFTHLDSRESKYYSRDGGKTTCSTFNNYFALNTYFASNNLIKEIAYKVIRGDFGNYPERKERVEAMGFNYDEVQKMVNILSKEG